ncbi:MULTISPECIES: ATP-binding protein [Rheinheimera]|jgi:signal transduction histidine kinase|uniref:histidine kinase n=1 Tax=Rheinheimera aquimaris TaxID=412437 RepID=A0ABN1DU00_9GAMM|nr:MULTISPECIES: ATP-binding protein [Rheinheimera]MCB5214128.1 sensor histidine kinase [Rheinheimera aquimaris]MCD1597660.1 sensor histidine kinase [Rheinheimera aquimaris]HBN89547.1 ATP-binding protein [Rheinheimera sp.]|tara:strand:+ start:850 stop:2598 length:1749 start_codon:yes stop_codon:yes gene_type:complete
MQHKSLSRKLLTKVLSVYFILTFVVTLGQIVAEYFNTKDHINGELETLQQTFSGSLTRAIWELNTQQAMIIADGLLAIPAIEGIIVRDDSGAVITQLGRYINIQERFSTQLVREGVRLTEQQSGIFGYTFPLIFEFSGRATQVGDVTLFSSRAVVIDRIKVGIYFLVGNAMLKTTFLIILFLMAFRKQLTLPLTELTQQIEDLELDQLDGAKVEIQHDDTSELSVMADAFNRLIGRVQDYKNQLETTQKQLLLSNEKLDQQNLMLEQEVARKTSGLSQAMMDLQQQKQELEVKQQSLREEIERRRHTEGALRGKQTELEKIVDDLKQAQDRLVQSEKMAALGGLVAGITHEVNTPVGIGVTATSFLAEKLQALSVAYADKTLTPKMLEHFIEEASQGTELLQSNLIRASELIASFKQIAVDQTSEAVRTINLADYLHEVIRSLQPNFKKTHHQIEVNCPDNIVLSCPAGAISQIFTNLLMNSLIHGFEDMEDGLVRITVLDEDDNVDIKYSDNGKGLSPDQLEKLFHPFFTTKRDQGGSGLGTHITYNLVRQTLGGSIQVSSEPGKGLHYHICFPKNLKIQS